MPLPRELSLTPEELDDLMRTTWNLRIATLGPGTRINLTPMWFGWAGGNIYFYGRGQKIANLRRDPNATILVDRNERFPELQGAMFQGRATVLEDAEAERADPHLAEAQAGMGPKYEGGHGGSGRTDYTARGARGRNWRWVRFTPARTVTWDNFKLPRPS
jgi:nitroimidazol reductase NimA-like FMN-containing flavoprotein (pyridoxamine 5'-phosphate oxidase superfamily)